MSLRNQHPNFWLVVIGDIVAFAWLGCAFTFVNNTSTTFRVIESVAPIRLFGIVELGLAAALLYGLVRSPTVFRVALNIGAGVVTLFAIGMASAIVDDLIEMGKTPAASAPALHLFFAICLVAQSREPRTNPDAQHA